MALPARRRGVLKRKTVKIGLRDRAACFVVLLHYQRRCRLVNLHYFLIDIREIHMQSKLLVALFAALALTACKKSEEAAAPAMEQAQEAAGAAADSAAEAADSAAEAAGAAADAAGEATTDAAAEAAQDTADAAQDMADKAKDAAQ
jgi:hypothetical protein